MLIGRDTEIAMLERFLTEVRSGGSLMLTGEPGIGLTALLEVAADSALDHGYRVLRAEAVAGRPVDVVPFSGLRRMLLPMRAELSTLTPEKAQVLGLHLNPGRDRELDPRPDPAADPIRIGVLMLGLLRAAASTGPMLLIVDDAHRLDPASFDVLQFVAGRLHGTGAVVLVAARQELTTRRAGWYLVPPLGVGAARDLLGSRFPMVSEPVAERILAEAAGNPLALHELPAVLTVTERAGAGPMPFGPPLTDRLRAGWEPYLAGLPAATRRLMLLVALDNLSTLDRLGRVIDEREESLADLSPGERARILRVTPAGALTFCHPLLRAVVVDLAGPEERSRVHLRWADALKDEPERRAWHLANAHHRPDGVVAEQLERSAGEARVQGDLDAAWVGLLRAAELSSTHEVRGRRYADAAYLAASAGRRVAATDLLAQAVAVDPALRWSLRAITVTALLNLSQDGRPHVQRRLADAIASHPGRTDPQDEPLIDALHVVGLWAALSGDADAWRLSERALARLRAPVPDHLAARLALHRRALGRRADLTVVDEAITALELASSWDQVMWTVQLAMQLNRAEDCRAPMRRFQPGPGSLNSLGVYSMFLLAQGYLASGEWRVAEDLLTGPETTTWLRARPVDSAGPWPGVLRGYLAALRGDRDRALTLAQQAEIYPLPEGFSQVGWLVAQVRAMTATGRGDFEEAYQQLSTISPPGTLDVRVGTPVHVALDLVEAAVRTGRTDEARAHVALLRSARIAELSYPQRVLVTAAGALVADTDAEAERLFEAALAVPGADRRPFDRARVQLLFGEQQRRARQPQRARTLLATARDTFTWLGAVPWADRASEELRAAGQSTPIRLLGRAGDADLAPQELRIAELAASGLTNKEIGRKLLLSPRTVGNYLYRIYPKLGITSRAGLSDALSGGIVPD